MFRFHILGFLKMIYLQELQSNTGSISLVGSTLAGISLVGSTLAGISLVGSTLVSLVGSTLAGMTIAVDRFFLF